MILDWKIVGLKSYSLGAGSAALLFLFLPLAKLLYARPQGERVVLSVGKIIFIIFKVEPFNIKHAPCVCFSLLIPFHFLLAWHNTFNRIRLGYFTYALSIIWRSPPHLGRFSHSLKSDQGRASSRSLQPLRVWFVYYFRGHICCPRLLWVNQGLAAVLTLWPTWTFSGRNLRQWCRTRSKHLLSFLVRISYLPYAPL